MTSSVVSFHEYKDHLDIEQIITDKKMRLAVCLPGCQARQGVPPEKTGDQTKTFGVGDQDFIN